MSTTSHYKIQSWIPVMSGSNIIQYPAIYIQPDIPFLEFAKNNEFRVACKISGTNTVHDNNTYIGYINQSGNFPNYRPNFFAQTGLYIVTLDTNWEGYPIESNGTVEFFGNNL
jgi:hypothetical protein